MSKNELEATRTMLVTTGNEWARPYVKKFLFPIKDNNCCLIFFVEDGMMCLKPCSFSQKHTKNSNITDNHVKKIKFERHPKYFNKYAPIKGAMAKTIGNIIP